MRNYIEKLCLGVSLFTPEWLLSLSISESEKHKALSKLYPIGTVNEERNWAREVSELAFFCASWMENNGFKELKYVGPFGVFPKNNIEKVTIQSGSLCKSTGKEREFVTKRKRKVYLSGGITHGYVYKGDVYQPQGRWSGSDRYWCWTDLNNISFEPCEDN